jgi:hypothetical protein
MRLAFPLFATTVLAGSAAAQVNLYEVRRIDLSVSFVTGTAYGTNVSAVAWNGADAWVAGYNNSGNTGSVGLAKVSNVWGAASLGSAFGVAAGTVNGRGYSGIDILGNSLASAYDNGSATANGIQSWNTGTESANWSKNARGGSGVAFDPGFGSVDSGVAWTTFGSGRRALQNAASGADIYTTANGMIINAGAGTFWRDMDFDDNTGDLYARRSNGLYKTTRTGGNSGTVSTLIAFNSAADAINGHNLAFMSDTVNGDLVIFNDRTSGGSGQGFTNIIKIVDSNGVAQTINWSFLGATLAGNGYYSFSFDAASQTLAVADFFNDTIHIFAVPAPSSLALLGLAGLAARRRR